VGREVFDKQLEELNQEILEIGKMTVDQISSSINALLKKDVENLESIMKEDLNVNIKRDKIEEMCVKMIALQQPFASDLRYIFTCIKIVTDFERIADYAVDISKIGIRISKSEFMDEIKYIIKMSDILIEMLKESIVAFDNKDEKMALQVCKMDDEIDLQYSKLYVDLTPKMAKGNIDDISQLTQLLFAAKYLERGGDHVTNICESIIFQKTGEFKDLNL